MGLVQRLRGGARGLGFLNVMAGCMLVDPGLPHFILRNWRCERTRGHRLTDSRRCKKVLLQGQKFGYRLDDPLDDKGGAPSHSRYNLMLKVRLSGVPNRQTR
jgi:hypothetical protein